MRKQMFFKKIFLIQLDYVHKIKEVAALHCNANAVLVYHSQNARRA